MLSLLPVTLFICLTACIRGDAPKAQVIIPGGWQKVDAEGHFTFYLPSTMRLSSTVRCEECAWGSTYSDDQIRLYAEYTSWNQEHNPEFLAKQPEYSKELTEVDGMRAKIQSWRSGDWAEGAGYTAEVKFYGSDGKLTAMMSAICKGRDGVKTAEQIFRTVDFPK